MKVKVSYEKKQFREATVEIPEEKFLGWVNQGYDQDEQFSSIDEIRNDPNESVRDLLVDFLDEEGVDDRFWTHVETGPDELDIVFAEEA